MSVSDARTAPDITDAPSPDLLKSAVPTGRSVYTIDAVAAISATPARLARWSVDAVPSVCARRPIAPRRTDFSALARRTVKTALTLQARHTRQTLKASFARRPVKAALTLCTALTLWPVSANLTWGASQPFTTVNAISTRRTWQATLTGESDLASRTFCAGWPLSTLLPLQASLTRRTIATGQSVDAVATWRAIYTVSYRLHPSLELVTELAHTPEHLINQLNPVRRDGHIIAPEIERRRANLLYAILNLPENLLPQRCSRLVYPSTRLRLSNLRTRENPPEVRTDLVYVPQKPCLDLLRICGEVGHRARENIEIA
jgi:hypothetical protein